MADRTQPQTLRRWNYRQRRRRSYRQRETELDGGGDGAIDGEVDEAMDDGGDGARWGRRRSIDGEGDGAMDDGGGQPLVRNRRGPCWGKLIGRNSAPSMERVQMIATFSLHA